MGAGWVPSGLFVCAKYLPAPPTNDHAAHGRLPAVLTAHANPPRTFYKAPPCRHCTYAHVSAPATWPNPHSGPISRFTPQPRQLTLTALELLTRPAGNDVVDLTLGQVEIARQFAVVVAGELAENLPVAQ